MSNAGSSPADLPLLPTGKNESVQGTSSRARSAFLLRKLWVPMSILCGFFVGGISLLCNGAPDGGYSIVLTRLSLFCGWSYFFAWSASFYPQVFLNHSRKSVVGLSFDYQLLNLFGYMAYFAFNGALFWSPHVQDEYKRAHADQVSAVRLNDVLFAGHAFVLTTITLILINTYQLN